MSTTDKGIFFTRWGGSQTIVVLTVLLLASLTIMVASFIFDSSASKQSTSRIVLLNEQQKVALEILKIVRDTQDGQPPETGVLSANTEKFTKLLDTLEHGGTSSGTDIPKLKGDEQLELLTPLKGTWQELEQELTIISNNQNANTSLKVTARRIRPFPAEVMQISSDISYLLLKAKQPIDTVLQASQMQVLIQSIVKNINAILLGRENILDAIEAAKNDTARFDKILSDLRFGSKEDNIKVVTDSRTALKLSNLQVNQFEPLQASVNSILTLAPGLFAVDKASKAATSKANALIASLDLLEKSLTKDSNTTQTTTYIGVGSGILVLILIATIAFMIWKEAQIRLATTTDANRRNQRAILKLLDEMSNLADGDLSTYATVTEDVTGAIADSVNYAIDALRDLVATINSSSDQIAIAASQTKTTAEQLTIASNSQTSDIISATEAISEMSDNMNSVSLEAESSVETAKSSLDIAASGTETARKNIEAMDTIREQIQDTSKRIKRLGESSQEIGDIIGLINEISDRTNILALNAAIQASTAGDAGRGFAVVADEVQRLAERTGDAAKQVEALVKAIQTDTNEAISSMEQTTTDVVKGAQLTESTGDALSEIEIVSKKLADLIQNISFSAQAQSKTASNLSGVMAEINDFAKQTTEGTLATSSSIGNLSSLSEDLRESVSGFKLPNTPLNGEVNESNLLGDANNTEDSSATAQVISQA